MDQISAYGFDPGLRHGAIVLGTFRFPEHRLVTLDVVYSWKASRKAPSPINHKSPPNDVARFVIRNLVPNFATPSYGVGIEYSPTSVYWRAQKSQIVVLAYMLGVLHAHLVHQGLPVTVFTVDEVRKAFGIARKDPKESYLSKPLCLNGLTPLTDQHRFSEELRNSDVFDGLMLAYLTAYMIWCKNG